MPKVSEEKITLLKQYGSEGYSIPEIAKLAGVSLPTTKKYLAEEVEAYIEPKQAEANANDVRATAFRNAHDLATKRIGLIKTITANKTKIISWRNKPGVNIPIAKDCEDYDELRLYEHLVYWVHKRKHKLKYTHRTYARIISREGFLSC